MTNDSHEGPAPVDWTVFERIADVSTVRSGTTLIEEARRVPTACALEEGLVRVSHWRADREVFVFWRQAPYLFGIESMLCGRPSPFSAVAVVRCRVRLLPEPALRRVLDAHPALTRQLLLYQSREVVDLAVRLRESTSTARRRLARSLFELGTQLGHPKGGNTVWLALPMTWDDLARSVDMTPQWQNRLLQIFEREGLVRRESGRRVLIPALDRLWHADETSYSEP